MKKSKQTNDHLLEKENENKSSRRRIIKTAVASTAAISAASQLNGGKWSKPVLDSVVLPGHAATTDDSGNLPGEGTTPNPCPNPLLCAAGPLGYVRPPGPFSVIVDRHDVTATVCPPVAGVEVALAVTAVNVDNARNPDGYLNGGTPQMTDASGVATFSEVVLRFGAETSGSATARLDLVFSSGSDECSLSLSFTESLSSPPM